MSATTTQLLSSGEFLNCVMTLYLLKVRLQTFLSIPVTQKCQIFSCGTLVANERNISEHKSKRNSLLHVVIASLFFNIVVMVRLRIRISGGAPVNS